MTYNMVMDYNVHEAKSNLSKILELVQKGQRVYFCKRNIRIAEVNPVKPEANPRITKHGARPLGGFEGQIDMTNFFDPMTDEELTAWGYPMEPETS